MDRKTNFIQINCHRDQIADALRVLYQSSRLLNKDELQPVEMRYFLSDLLVAGSFYRYLDQKGILYDLRAGNHFDLNEQFQILLGGRKLNFSNHLITHSKMVERVNHRSQVLLQEKIFLPEPRFTQAQDIMIFSAVCGNQVRSYQDVLRKESEGKPVNLIAAMKETRDLRTSQESCRKFIFINHNPFPLTLKLHGVKTNRKYDFIKIKLVPGEEKKMDIDLSRIYLLNINQVPKEKIEIICPNEKLNVSISPFDWKNIWFYQPKIWFLGYLEVGELSDFQMINFDGKKTLGERNLIGKGYLVPVSDLRPLMPLLAGAKSWGEERRD